MTFIQKFLNDDIFKNLLTVSHSSLTLENKAINLKQAVSDQEFYITSISESLKEVTKKLNLLFTDFRNFQNSLKNLLNISKENSIIVSEIKEIIEENKENCKTIYNFMNLIIKEFYEISNLTKEINSLLDKIKIVSINTAIEAAKAGEHGKGFFVISNEMKKISDFAIKLTNQIENKNKTLNSNTKNLFSNIEKSVDFNNKLSNLMNKFYNDFKIIKNESINLNEKLDYQIDSLHNKIESIENISNKLDSISKSGNTILQETDDINKISKNLHKNLEENLTSMSNNYSDNFKENIVKELFPLLKSIDKSVINKKDILDNILRDFINKGNVIELLYVLNKDGIQISSNVVAKKYQDIISDYGYRVDRSDKDYYKVPKKTKSFYITPIYISSASKSLCLTVSIPLIDDSNDIYGFVLGDINLNDLYFFLNKV